ncbi:MAG: chemotaxis protein CheX [Oligoflexia bacterium]|nr:chemotaxis protein CheX [Oligoflexia bacterium]
MGADLIGPFRNATISVLSTMAATVPVPGEPRQSGDAVHFGAVTGLIGLTSPTAHGNLLLTFDEQSILNVVSRMFGEQILAINQEVIDAVGEITNMVCGGAKRELAEQGLKFDMATPLVVTGNHLELLHISKSRIVSIPFSTPEGKFEVATTLEVQD